MTQPRPVVPGNIYLVTRRCLERRFLLNPEPEVVRIFGYVLAVMLARHGVELLGAVQMSNHHHLVVHDVRGNIPMFMRDLHAFTARAVNRHLRRKDVFWEGTQAALTELVDAAAVEDILAYVACNPVAAGLVTVGKEWPGMRTSPWAVTQRPRVFERPSGFFGDGDSWPAVASLTVVVPPTHRHLSASAFAENLARQVERREASLVQNLRRAGHRFPSLKTLVRADWRVIPPLSEEKNSSRPTVAARCPERRRHARERLMVFRLCYRVAREAFLNDQRDVSFPPGTWMLPVLFGANVLPPPRPSWAT